MTRPKTCISKGKVRKMNKVFFSTIVGGGLLFAAGMAVLASSDKRQAFYRGQAFPENFKITAKTISMTPSEDARRVKNQKENAQEKIEKYSGKAQNSDCLTNGEK